MTPERWQQIRDVLEKALEMAPSERSAFLNQACSSDSSLRQEVGTLLASSDGVRSSFLQSPPLTDLLDAASNGPGSAGGLEPGQVFAQHFRLECKLGEGGMGQVWLADQISPVRRQVALKLIKAGMYDESVVRRFQSERQSLAMMDHPAIAKVFDAGATPQGQPYFVMEYVPGLAITEYCDQKKLKIRDRLELFIQACGGVQHAHQKAIIHRDLKPANILVMEVDGKPVPRIIDFGLAKGAKSQIEGETLFTQVGHFVGTPGYMSPEQADPGFRNDVQDIDTRTDVYSLGVILYVLLAGLLPFGTGQKQKPPLEEWLRKLREEEPPRPSTKVSNDRETSTSTAEARGTERKQLVSMLRGDLDCITMKAMEKDRSRRYGAPSELATDIRRYLNHEPVVARPARATYRSGKFIKRHKLALAVAAVFLVVLLAGAVAIVREARIARIQEARAEKRFETLRKLTNSLLFEFHDSIEKLPGSTEARELVVRRALKYLDQIAAEANSDPATLRDLAAAYERIGSIQAEQQHPHLGGKESIEQAKRLYDKALAIRQGLAAAKPDDRTLQIELTNTMFADAGMHSNSGDLDRGLELHLQIMEILKRLQAHQDSPDIQQRIAGALVGVAVTKDWLGDYDSAFADLRQAATVNQALLDANPTRRGVQRNLGVDHAWLAATLLHERRYTEAAGEEKKALAIWEQLGAADPNNTEMQRAIAETNEELCRCLAYAGNVSEVRAPCRKSLAILENMVKSDKNDVQALADLASVNSSMGVALYVIHSPQEALPFERRSDSLYDDVAVRDPDTIGNILDHATNLVYLGRTEAVLHRPALAQKDLARAQEMLEGVAKRSPKSRQTQDALDETRAAIKALPNDTAPINPF